MGGREKEATTFKTQFIELAVVEIFISKPVIVFTLTCLSGGIEYQIEAEASLVPAQIRMPGQTMKHSKLKLRN